MTNRQPHRPAILRCFMAYIIDLVIIMYLVFNLDGPVTREQVRETVDTFQSQTKDIVHAEIRDFVSRRGVVEIFVNRDDVFEKIVELICQHTVSSEASGLTVSGPEEGT